MLTRSKAKKPCSEKSAKNESVATNSTSTTIQARVLAAEAEHLRRITDMENAGRERALAAERAVAEAEHRARIAALEAEAGSSRRSSFRSFVGEWLEQSNPIENNPIALDVPQPLVQTTLHAASTLPVPSEPLTGVMVAAPSDVVLSAVQQQQDPDCYAQQTPNPCDTTSLPYVSTALPHSLPAVANCLSYVYSAPIITTAPRGGTLPFTAPVLTTGDACVQSHANGIGTPHATVPTATLGGVRTEVHDRGRMPVDPAVQDHTLNNTHRLGTQPHMFNCCNINKNSSKSDTLRLAEAIAEVAASGASRTPRVSVPLPIFDGQATDWLIFKRMYQNTSSSYSPTENLIRIGSALKGAARSAVAVLLAAACDPAEVMRALEVEFARPERIILAELSAVRALPKISNLESSTEINAFACRIRHCVEVVRLLNVPEYMASPELSNEIVGKLTISLRSRWTDFAYAREHLNIFRLELLSEFLVHEANLKSKYDFVHEPVKRDTNVKPIRCHVTMESKPSLTIKKVCLYCNKIGHLVDNCNDFKTISIDDRWEWVTSKKVCHKCFTKGTHFYRKCKKFSCEYENCRSKGTHHSLLHKEPTQAVNALHHADVAGAPVASDDSTSTDIVTHSITPASSRRPLLKVLPVKVSGPKGTVQTYALLDDGSTATLVDSSVANAVGATGKRTVLRVNGVGGMSQESEATFVSLEIQGYHSSSTFMLQNVRSISNLNLSSQTIKSDELRSYDHLVDLVEEVSYDDAKPMLLIGIDNWHLTVPCSVRRGSQSQPVAALTALGWVLFGFTKSKSSPVEFVNHCSAIDGVDSLDRQLKEYFRVDSIGISKKEYLSENDKRVIAILDETTCRLPSGRFETGLLWRADIKNVPDSRNLALSRFISLENKMKKDKVYADAYRDNINSMIQKRYAELCDERSKSSITWYLPHFGVFHPQKRKLRVVHDAAATSSNVSLNSLLLSGPDLLQPLLSVLMRFREGAVGLNGDIREMFPQTKIRPEDRDAQSFLWRDDPSQPLKEFRMSSMIFGATSSPFTAIYLKNRNAEEHRATFPAAADAIVNDHYMDDYLGSVDSVDEAAQLVADIVGVHAKACLEMRSWVSNRPEALSLIPTDLCLPNAASVVVRILGVSWSPNDDKLSFLRSSFGDRPTKLTKRSILAFLMRVYDPLGFLTPVVLKGRLIFQETWKSTMTWDQELPSTLSAKWNAWFQELISLSSGSIPRHYLAQRQAESAQLHVFGDASELAYSCVAYWRFSCVGGGVLLSLIGGKARLAPMKLVSIPRLELQAALMAARFASYIIKAHKRKPSELYLWSDSLTVLKWLRSDAQSFKAFVGHRVGEILELTNAKNWHYVPTALNVADDATRVNRPFDMSSRWFSGPSFLTECPSQWPKEPSSSTLLGADEFKPDISKTKQTDLQLVTLTSDVHKFTLPVVAKPCHFSEWLRLLRATARVIQCAKQFRALLNRSNSVLQHTGQSVSVSHPKFPLLEVGILEQAERNLFIYSQLESFEEEYTALMGGNPIHKTSKLRQFSVYLDNGLLRLRGRIAAAQDVNIEKDSIVLHGKNYIAKLIIFFHHMKTAQSGEGIVVSELRQRFYIVGLRLAVKSVLKACLQCKLRKDTPSCPPVGDLPPERLAHHVRPFTHVGLDYFGPVTVAVGRRSEKRYVALFTCLSVRAVHLEVVGSLSTDSAIMALRRFIARRGTPQTIYSDNGTAFVGANRELRKLYEEPIHEFATNQLIRWKFIPPAAPFMGGCWERLVKSVKTALFTTLKTRTPSEETFTTFLLEVESILNSRPLTHVDTDPDSDLPITPFHFILGSPSTYSPLAQLNEADLLRRVRWRKSLRLADHFWARWLKEYLPSLIPRAAMPASKNLYIGDLVLIADGNLPRGVWPRGRIVRVLPGSDGVVRIADVSTAHGVLRRPTKKLVRLQVDPQELPISVMLP